MGPDHPPRAHLARPGYHRRDGDRLAALHRRRDLAKLGEAGPVHRLDEDVDDPAAGQPHRECVVVADAVGLEHGVAGPACLEGQLVHRALDAAARHAAHDLARVRGRHRQRRAGVTGRAAEGPHHGGQAERLPCLPPFRDLAQDVTHRVTSASAIMSTEPAACPSLFPCRGTAAAASAGPGPSGPGRPGRAGRDAHSTILEMGISRMSCAPAALSAGISVLTSRLSATVSTAFMPPLASVVMVGEDSAGSISVTAASRSAGTLSLSSTLPRAWIAPRSSSAMSSMAARLAGSANAAADAISSV